jgi:hypothetical protein
MSLSGDWRCLLERLAGCLIAQVARLPESRLGEGHIFRSFDSFPVHDPDVKAPRRVSRVAGAFEDLPCLS